MINYFFTFQTYLDCWISYYILWKQMEMYIKSFSHLWIWLIDKNLAWWIILPHVSIWFNLTDATNPIQLMRLFSQIFPTVGFGWRSLLLIGPKWNGLISGLQSRNFSSWHSAAFVCCWIFPNSLLSKLLKHIHIMGWNLFWRNITNFLINYEL